MPLDHNSHIIANSRASAGKREMLPNVEQTPEVTLPGDVASLSDLAFRQFRWTSEVLTLRFPPCDPGVKMVIIGVTPPIKSRTD
jgi:hypothetical protein